MHRFQLAFFFSASLIVASCPALAGVETVEIGKVQVVRALAGVVRGPNGDPISGATVEEVSADQKTVLRKVVTDKDGRFVLRSTPGRNIHHLMVSAHQFNPLLVHVRMSRWTRKLLDLHIEVST